MRSPWWGCVLLGAGLLRSANAQFTLSAVVDNAERQVVGVYDLGTVSAGDPAAARFRLRNSSNAPATLTLLAVAGAGFSLASAPSLPATLNAQAAVEFTVNFRAGDTGNYSAVLRSDGISVLLTMAVAPSLFYAVETAVGKQALGAAPVDFGEVELGLSGLRHFDIENRSTQALAVPAIAVGTGDFGLSGEAPGGKLLQPGAATGFDIQFQPAVAGTRNGVLTINSRSYTLAGTGITPPLPKPRIQIDLPQTGSAQQGAITVKLNPPARSKGSGTLTLDFQPASPGVSDAAIALASGGRTAPFAFQPGDTQGRFGGQTTVLFQTGTTAGTLTVTAQLGDASDRQPVTIAPALAGLSAASAAKSAGSIEIQITGYDNTRTAGQLSFAFFDVGGNVIAPGTIRADGSPAFARYFQGSDLGGTFLLRAVFPVTGDSSVIAFFSAEITNSAGTAATAKTRF